MSAPFRQPQVSSIGPELELRRLPWPRSRIGFAVDIGGLTVIVGDGGEDYGHLKGIYVDELSSSSPGPVLLRDVSNPMSNYAFDSSVYNLNSFSQPELVMAKGALVERFIDGRSNIVLKAGTVYWDSREGRCCIRIATGRSIVSRIQGLENFVAYDLLTRSELSVPNECLPLGRSLFGTYLSCSGAQGGRLDFVSPGGTTRSLTGSPLGDDGGEWSRLLPSPQGTALLGGWTGSCGSDAFLISPLTGKTIPLLADPVRASFESRPLGWADDARMFVDIRMRRCGGQSKDATVVALDSRGGAVPVFRNTSVESIAAWWLSPAWTN